MSLSAIFPLYLLSITLLYILKNLMSLGKSVIFISSSSVLFEISYFILLSLYCMHFSSLMVSLWFLYSVLLRNRCWEIPHIECSRVNLKCPLRSLVNLTYFLLRKFSYSSMWGLILCNLIALVCQFFYHSDFLVFLVAQK